MLVICPNLTNVLHKICLMLSIRFSPSTVLLLLGPIQLYLADVGHGLS